MPEDAPGRDPARRKPEASAAWPAFWLCLALVSAKAIHWGAPPTSREDLRIWGRDWLASSGADLLFAAGFFVCAELLLRALVGWPRARSSARWVVVGLGVVFVIYTVASVPIFTYLRSPLTYPLLYLAGDMGSMRSSLGSFLSGPVAAAFVVAPTAYLFLVIGAGRLLPFGDGLRSTLVEALGLTLVVYAGLRGREIAGGPWRDRDDRLIAESPHWVLASSYARELLGGQSPLTGAEAFPAEYLKDFEVTTKPATTARIPTGVRPKNVILVVLESTATRYLSLYGSRYKTTPVLDAAAAHALVFDNFYCHVGMSANSMAAITLSLFPYMTWREYTVEYPDMPGTSLAQVLKARGFRTSFIHSGDLSYGGGAAFLKNRGFDDIIDSNVLGCTAQTSWGCEDRFLVDGLLQWIDADCETPFFIMAWTSESHHPYEPSPGRPFVDFFKDGALPPDDYDLGRYLNTLGEVDRQLGRLFQGLRERNMEKNTLVAITGDHGEAFGDPHRTWGHGARLYEENVHVPLVLWSPGLYPQGRHASQIGSHVDLCPTLADIMGVPAQPSWHGRSVFDRLHTPRAYFYAANDDYLLGVREGDWKYIYNATLGRDELFNLKTDPLEQKNAAAQQRDRVGRLRQRLAAWKHYVGHELAKIQEAGPRAGGAATPSPVVNSPGEHPHSR